MSERVPSFFLIVPGPWRRPGELVVELKRREIACREYSAVPIGRGEVVVDVIEEPELSRGFAWGRNGPSPEPLVRRVASHSQAALIEVGGLLDERPGQLAELGRALRELGGAAVRMEGSGAASAWEPWLEQVESGSPAQLYAASVLVVQGKDGACFTCGMRDFGLPDAEMAAEDPQLAMEWLDAFCTFLLEERPVLGSGHTFGLDADSPSDGALARPSTPSPRWETQSLRSLATLAGGDLAHRAVLPNSCHHAVTRRDTDRE